MDLLEEENHALKSQYENLLQRLEQVEAGNAAARPYGQARFLVRAQHECRPVKALHHPAGDNPYDAWVPTFAVHHDERRNIGRRRLRQSPDDLIHNRLLRSLAIGVQPVEPNVTLSSIC